MTTVTKTDLIDHGGDIDGGTSYKIDINAAQVSKVGHRVRNVVTQVLHALP